MEHVKDTKNNSISLVQSVHTNSKTKGLVGLNENYTTQTGRKKAEFKQTF